MLAGAGSRRWVWLDLDATTSQGNAGEDHGAGGVIGIGGDPDALGSRSLAMLEPICQSRDLGGGDERGGSGSAGALAPADGPDGDAPAAPAAGSFPPAADAPINHQAPRSNQRFGLRQNRCTASKRRTLNPAAHTRPPA